MPGLLVNKNSILTSRLIQIQILDQNHQNCVLVKRRTNIETSNWLDKNYPEQLTGSDLKKSPFRNFRLHLESSSEFNDLEKTVYYFQHCFSYKHYKF